MNMVYSGGYLPSRHAHTSYPQFDHPITARVKHYSLVPYIIMIFIFRKTVTLFLFLFKNAHICREAEPGLTVLLFPDLSLKTFLSYMCFSKSMQNTFGLKLRTVKVLLYSRNLGSLTCISTSRLIGDDIRSFPCS